MNKTYTFLFPATALVAGLAGFLSPLAAEAGSGWYLGLEGGANFAEDQNFDIYGLDPLIGGVEDGSEFAEVGFDGGYVGGLLVGYGFAKAARLEFELARRHEDFDTIDLANGGRSERVDGEQDTDIAMLNLWFDLFPSGRVHPYIGGGVGAARIDISDPGFDSSTFVDGDALRDDDDTVFAYQGGAGIGFDLGDQWTLSLDYRYLRTEDAEFDLLENTPNTHVEAEYESHAALASIRYYFRGPPPEPVPEPEPVAVVAPVEPPPPPPAPPRPPPCAPPEPGQPMTLDGCKTGDTIVLRGVNFEFDKSSLTVNAKTILDQVADALAKHGAIKIEIQGHTDGKGSDTYNQQLSERRAKSVQQYLEGKGIDDGRMSAVGLGEGMPVADNETDEGRELNRRVELKIVEGGYVAPAPAPAPDPAPAADAATDGTTTDGSTAMPDG